MKSLYLSLIFIYSFTHLNAQWSKIHESEQGSVGVIHSLSGEEVWFANQFQTSLTKIEDANVHVTSFDNFGFLSDLQFLNQDVGYLSGGCYFVTEDCPSTTLYKTTDGGENWENLLSNVFTSGVFQYISLPSENDIYILADAYGLLHSSDAGENWEEVNLPSEYSPNSFIAAQFLTHEIGFIVFIDGYEITPDGYVWNNVILSTEDGGENWEKISEMPLIDNEIFDMSFYSPEIGYLILRDNVLYKTENGGISWEEYTVGSDQETILSFELVNNEVAYLSTSDSEEFRSRIYKTENGGQSWTIDASFENTFVEQLHFIDEENGFAGVGNELYQRMGTTNTAEPALLDFEVFPNPSSDGITIQLEDISSLPMSLIVRNQLGQVVMEKQLFDSNTSISIRHFPASVYYLEVRDEDGSSLGIEKLIKK